MTVKELQKNKKEPMASEFRSHRLLSFMLLYDEIVLYGGIQLPDVQGGVAFQAQEVFVSYRESTRRKDCLTIIDEDLNRAVVDEDAHVMQTFGQRTGPHFALVDMEAALHAGPIDR